MPFINISVKTDENHAMITVKDNGVGIEQANIDNVFDLYFRANRQDIPGNGLGLYVVKSIVEDLEGDIRIKSNINKGTCLEIRIPNP
jgi:signal transduction histidine kinase